VLEDDAEVRTAHRGLVGPRGGGARTLEAHGSALVWSRVIGKGEGMPGVGFVWRASKLNHPGRAHVNVR
jgi:hypothetical protein